MVDPNIPRHTPFDIRGEISEEQQRDAVWLSEAAAKFGSHAEQMKAAAARFRALGDGESPETFEWTSDLPAGLERDSVLEQRLTNTLGVPPALPGRQ
jgi:hypothetical protein